MDTYALLDRAQRSPYSGDMGIVLAILIVWICVAAIMAGWKAGGKAERWLKH